MAQKIARLHIAREPGHLYFVKDSAVFATPIKGGKGGRKKVGTFKHEHDPAYMYFLDADGDVARAMRGGRKKKAAKAPRAAKAVKAPKAAKKAAKKASKRAAKSTKDERARARATLNAVIRDMRGLNKRLR